MTPERRAEVVAQLRGYARGTRTLDFTSADEAADVLEAMGRCTCWGQHLHGARCPLANPPKSAEASMKERIEGLEGGIERAIAWHGGHVHSGRREACSECVLVADLRALLDGPSDPDRGRETTKEIVAP